MESDSKTILLFTDWYLPGYKAGGPIVSCANLIEHLGEDYNFKVVCGDRDYLETEPYQDVPFDKWVTVGKAQVMYLSQGRQGLNPIKEIISEVAPDLIYLNGMFSKTFTIIPLFALRNTATKVVIAPRGMLAPAALGIRSFKKKVFLKLAKSFGLFSRVKFHATNSMEAKQISAWFGKAAIEVVPNIPGVPHGSNLRYEHKKQKENLRLYTVARIAPEKNIHFAMECLRVIDNTISVDFEIIGAVYDEGYYARCQKIVGSLPSNVKVNFLGPVPKADIPRIASKADFFFLPTAGENYGHAIVEAMLSGVPVVISTQTPWRNLKNVHLGFDLDLNHEAFSKTLNELGKMTDDDYSEAYRNVKTDAKALVNLDKLQNGYKKLFNDRNRS